MLWKNDVLTNNTNIPLSLAVWLAAESDYDHSPDPRVISATTLLKPLRSLVLTRRLEVKGDIDINDLVASKLGTSVHTAAEIAWRFRMEQALTSLGYPSEVIRNIAVNPRENIPGILSVYIERRSNRELCGYTVTGKFDFVIDGRLSDIKTTSAWSYVFGSNDDRYRMQGSIYRWLNPDIITDPQMSIDYLFTDWSATKAKADPSGYPPSRCLSKTFPLFSLEDTESFLVKKLTQLKSCEDLDQAELPRCSPAELWMDAPKWAVYKDPAKTSRATKLLDSETDALTFNALMCKSKGLIVKREGEPKFCRWCEARTVCMQAERYIAQGILNV